MEDAQAQFLQNIHREILSGAFCDIQVVCKDGTTNGSRLVLAALSPYFRAMFSTDMSESETGVLSLPSVCVSVFQDILKMCFSRNNSITEDNCVYVLDAAEMFQLDHIKQLCNTYMKKGLVLTAENCLHWWRLFKLYNFLDLTKRALSFVTDNLDDFVEKEDVIQLSKEELLEIISKDDLKCEEVSVLKAAMKWIDHNNPDSEEVIAIFDNVSLDNVDPQFLINEVAFSDLVSQCIPIRQRMQKVVCKSVTSRISRSRFRCKTPDVFVLQRNDKYLLSRFTSDYTWEDVPPAPVDPGVWYSAAWLNEKIYITGGENKPTCTLIYDIISRVWTVGPDLTQLHRLHCMATANYKVYTIGGIYNNTIEELNESKTQWQVVGDLGLKRCDVFAMSVGENILVMGGSVSHNKSDVIQCFNTRTRSVSTLNTQLSCTSTALRGYVHLPDVYLLDCDGNVMHIQVTDSDGEIHIEKKFTTKWKSFSCYFGITHRAGRLSCFTKHGIKTFNLGDGKEEESSLPKPVRQGDVHGILA